MRKTRYALVSTLAVGLVGAALPVAQAADCPPELATAKSALSQALATAQAGAADQSAARQNMPDVKAPRQNMPDVKAPRQNMPDVKAPQSAQEGPMPRQNMPDVKAPRQNMPDVRAPRIKRAQALIRQSERACQKGDMALSAEKAKKALTLLK